MEIINNGRPKGSKDSFKRKTKKILTVKDERYIKEYWNSKSVKWFAEYFNISRAAILNVAKRNKFHKIESIFNKKMCSIEDMKDKTGIYGIITSDNMVYIGSSINIGNRVKSHINKLQTNSHFNKSLQLSYDQSIKFCVLEECNEKDLLEKEYYYIQKIRNTHNKLESIKIINECNIALMYDKIMKNCTITNDGCLEYNIKPHGSGYIYIQIKDSKNKLKMSTHRVTYFYHNKDENQKIIIRHKCKNKKCCNPKHLESGSVSQNNFDVKREEMGKFCKRFYETECDRKILSDEFNIELKTVKNRIRALKLNKEAIKFDKNKRLEIKNKEKEKKIAERNKRKEEQKRIREEEKLKNKKNKKVYCQETNRLNRQKRMNNIIKKRREEYEINNGCLLHMSVGLNND